MGSEITRDPFGELVYRWEDELRNARASRAVSEDGVCRLISDAWRFARDLGWGCSGWAPAVTFTRESSRHQAWASKRSLHITIGTGATDYVVLHECAHHIAGLADGHGRFFARAALDLYVRFLRVNEQAAIAAAEHHGVELADEFDFKVRRGRF